MKWIKCQIMMTYKACQMKGPLLKCKRGNGSNINNLTWEHLHLKKIGSLKSVADRGCTRDNPRYNASSPKK